MKQSLRLVVGIAAFLGITLTGISPAYAGCLDNAGDVIFGVFSGGASVAACELKELVDSLENLAKMVADLAANVASNAAKITKAAIGAVSSAAKDIANAVHDAQQALGQAVSQAKTMTATVAMSPGALSHLAAPGNGATPHGAVMPIHVPNLAPPGGAHSAPQHMVSHLPAIQQADPRRLKAALKRGLQALTDMKRRVDHDAVSRIDATLQRASNQAHSHLSDAANIVQTALLSPIHSLQHLLSTLIKNPAQLADPVATVNSMINDITHNVASTLNHINDVITHDAIVTLGGVEADVQSIQSTAQEGDKLLGLMRRADRERTRAALQALESELNIVAPQPMTIAKPNVFASRARASFRFAPVRTKLNVRLAQAIAPTQRLANNLASSWAAIRARHPNVRMRPLGPSYLRTAKAELDRRFLGKPPAQIARAKQALLNQARQRYGSNPQLMAAIQHNLDSYLRTHSLAGMRTPVMTIRPQAAAPRIRTGGIRQ